MAAHALIDTNLLVYRYDDRFPDKQRIAVDVLRDSIETGSARIPHQSIIEFVAATTRGGPENQLLDAADALREAEELMVQFPIIYPDEAVLRTALRGAAAYGLCWFDAHIWAYTEVHGMAEQSITPHSVRECWGGQMPRGSVSPNYTKSSKSDGITKSIGEAEKMTQARSPTNLLGK